MNPGPVSDHRGHGQAEETRRFRQRNVEVEAAFFLPLLSRGMTLLDIGCGPGSITLGLAGRVSPGRVIGVDIDPVRIESASIAADDSGAGNVSFQIADAVNLPFDDAHFDAVFANGLVEHLPDQRAGLAELKRVLKPCGVIGVRSPDWGVALLEPDSETMRASINLRNRWQHHSGGHPETGRRLRRLLIETGFADVSAGASAESHGTDSGAAEGARYMHSILEDPALALLAAERNWANADEIQEMRQAWTDWSKQPGAFASFLWCHATGRAPSDS
ncbi:MAG: methyltransferase domain-containing protein [Chloroflexi bacterium]|nr:methyltransferase domain-containing protein [Chloroflexota bacterium]